MNIKPHLILAGVICLLLISVSAQDKAQDCPKPKTSSQSLTGTISVKDHKPIEIVGKAVFTLTAMNADDSLEGILTFTLSDKGRQTIAQVIQKPLTEIPAAISAKEVVGQFQKQTECPVLQLDFPSMELEAAGARVKLERFTLNLKESDDGVTIYLCTIARQIKRGFGHHSVRRVNERLNCDVKKN
jgi:hypothetical protein